MNANVTSTMNRATAVLILFVTTTALEATPFTPLALGVSAVGQPPAVRESNQQRLSRRDVDRLLEEAQTAIHEGDLQKAEVLVRRAESSGARYSLLHFGPTPASVRRELIRARQTRPSNQTRPQTASQQGVQPTGPASQRSGGTVDPFADAKTRLPAAPGTQPIPPSASGQQLDALSPPGQPNPQINVPGLGRPTNNPFKDPAARGGGASLADALQAQPHLVVSDQGLVEQPNYRVQSEVGTRYALTSAGTQSQVPATEQPTQKTSAAGDAKTRALDLISQARTALAEGDLSRAESLARQASALNVPESSFLPNEDRPSAIAWDLLKAKSQPTPQASKAQPAAQQVVPATSEAAESSDGDSQGIVWSTDGTTQALHIPAADASAAVPAAAQAAPPTDSLRFAQLPATSQAEPLATPLTARPSADGSDDPLSDLSRDPFADEPLPPNEPNRLPEPPVQVAGSQAERMLAAGEQALRNQDRGRALELFREALLLSDQLDQASRSRLQAHLQMLSPSPPAALPTSPGDSPALLRAADEDQQVLARQLATAVSQRQTEARRIREEQPREALRSLQEVKQQVTDAQLAADVRDQLLRRVSISIADTEKFIQEHRAEIELDEQNQAVLDEIDRQRAVKLKVQEQIAQLVDEFNKLRDEQRYAEMEIIAQRLYELAPEEEISQQIMKTAKFIRRTMINRQLADDREESFWATMNAVEESSFAPVGIDSGPVYPDAKEWDQLVKNRRGSSDRTSRRSQRELEIERRLKTPVLLRYEARPLAEVIDGLSQLTGVNIHLDPLGLSQEGITTDTPVTINLSKEISLKSALNLILEPLHLSYVIKDEVLKVTSEQLRDGEIFPDIYNVADLVIPIPNFVPSNNIGLQGLLNDAYASMGYGAHGYGAPGPAVLVNSPGPRPSLGGPNDSVLAQQFSGPGGGSPAMSMPIGGGPGGLGGGANADFDSLIDLIISTVATDTWAENGGGEAEVRPFPTNLSLVISQTQAVHEEIADLLEQLRRLQDLQVTIEVRFIRLSDSFFERIGIDFDMNIEDRTSGDTDLTPGTSFEPRRSSTIVGLDPPTGIDDFPRFTSNLDVPFRQNTFDLTTPTFGGFSMGDGARFGFALLSDIEAYFLVEAAQADVRTNVLNAPKVTLFNGQQAFVADATSQPFVISVIPVVGEFAAAQQPVIVVLNEGTLMSIQAVVSDDRRYVRLTVVPFFSEIGNVDTFTFEGSTSSTSSSSTAIDDDDDSIRRDDNSSANTTVGTTVQLPSFTFVSVVTTVSVPDGGTVLLGGIKRLSEGRNEVGVPLLSKLPYINRLFRNVGIGRETDSLMMMVTPRIIIQEEEEEKLGVVAQ